MTEIRGRKSETSKATMLGTMVFVLCSLLLAPCSSAQAQQARKITRVCQLGNNAANQTDIYMKMFRGRLAELGYIEARNVIIEHRFYEGKPERLPELAAELVRLKCDIILTRGTEAAEAAKNATKTIPIVMAFADNAVKSGIVADLAHPGGNITGLTTIGAEIYGKRLELLKETVPGLTRVAFFWSPSNSTAARNVKETEPVAQFLRVVIQSVEVKKPEDFEGAFSAATKGGANGLMLAGAGLFAFHEKRIVDLVVKNRLPAMYVVARFVEVGGLMSYAEDRLEMFRRAAEIVDKILKGTKPADIAVERPKKFDFVINLKAAKQIGLTIPPNVLARADRVIK